MEKNAVPDQPWACEAAHESTPQAQRLAPDDVDRFDDNNTERFAWQATRPTTSTIKFGAWDGMVVGGAVQRWNGAEKAERVERAVST